MTTLTPRRLTQGRASRPAGVVDVPTAAAAVGIGRSAAFELIREGLWPTTIVRLGKPNRIPTASLLDALSVSR